MRSARGLTEVCMINTNNGNPVTGRYFHFEVDCTLKKKYEKTNDFSAGIKKFSHLHLHQCISCLNGGCFRKRKRSGLRAKQPGNTEKHRVSCQMPAYLDSGWKKQTDNNQYDSFHPVSSCPPSLKCVMPSFFNQKSYPAGKKTIRLNTNCLWMQTAQAICRLGNGQKTFSDFICTTGVYIAIFLIFTISYSYAHDGFSRAGRSVQITDTSRIHGPEKQSGLTGHPSPERRRNRSGLAVSNFADQKKEPVFLAQSEPSFRDLFVRVEPGQTIRDVAKKYLGNSDLWEFILQENRLNYAHEVKPGMRLRIPVSRIKGAVQGIDSSRKKISEATRLGAKIFAPLLIKEAVQAREQAVRLQKKGKWEESIRFAEESLGKAEKAISISRQNQNVPAQAVIQNLSGKVSKKRPEGIDWEEISRYEVLLEGEKIRTLSDSYADILFRDNSQLHLEENAQALIQRMRANLLENTEEASVSIVKGDVKAFLTGGGKKKRVQVDVPGIKTRINSSNFWIGKDDKVTRIANYEGEIEISSAGEKVVLRENQGSIVRENSRPTPPQALLPSPKHKAPENGTSFSSLRFAFIWHPVTGTDHYILEIAKEAGFDRILWSEKHRDNKGAFPEHLGGGTYYWRVTAYSKDGLPGKPSTPYLFRIMIDTTPPFLVIEAPKQGAVITTQEIQVKGETEKDSAVTINSQKVETDTEGNFSHPVLLDDIKNTITIVATDSSSNISKKEVTVYYAPKKEVSLSFSDALPSIRENCFVTNTRQFMLFGTTNPFSRISVSKEKTENILSETSSDEKGSFNLRVPASPEGEKFVLSITTKAGETRKEGFSVVLDTTPPKIMLDKDIPSAVSAPELTISGTSEDAVRFLLNGEEIALENGRFSKTLHLKNAKNQIRMESLDKAGNIGMYKKEVILDTLPPEPVSWKLAPKVVKGNAKILIQVRAKDMTGLKKIAPFTVHVGEKPVSGHLIRKDNDTYEGSLLVEEKTNAKVKFSSITLSDYLGNEKEYHLEP